MVCVYCTTDTQVINSRPQKRSNSVWRRRKCLDCGAVFTTIEHVDLGQSISVRRTMHGRSLENFSRDVLYVSIYESLRHRPTATADATALTTTIITRLLPARDATIDREHIVVTALDVLEHFDVAAATHYRAFHPPRA